MNTEDYSILVKAHDTMRQQIIKEPWVLEGVRRIQRAKRWTVETPSDVLAEASLTALLILDPERDVWTGTKPVPLALRLFFAQLCRDSIPVLWEEELLFAARSMKVPDGSRWDCSVGNPPQYWTWPTALSSESGDLELFSLLVVDSETIRAYYNAIGGDESAGWTGEHWTDFYLITQPSNQTDRLDIHRFSMHEGSVYPASYLSDLYSAAAYFGMTTFLASPYIPREQVRPPRAMRREAERYGIKVPEATFLTLRKQRQVAGHEEGQDSVRPATEHAREYTRRWLVDMFPRNQACGPGWKNHVLRLVKPHIRGPADKPLIITPRKVVR